MYGENWAEIAEHVGTRSQVRTRSRVRSSGLTDAVHSPPPGVAVAGGRVMQGTRRLCGSYPYGPRLLCADIGGCCAAGAVCGALSAAADRG